MHIQGYNGRIDPCRYIAEVALQRGNRFHKEDIFISDTATSNYLSRDACIAFGIIPKEFPNEEVIGIKGGDEASGCKVWDKVPQNKMGSQVWDKVPQNQMNAQVWDKVHGHMTWAYDPTSKDLKPIKDGTSVWVQNRTTKKWDSMAVVIHRIRNRA